MKKFSLKLRHKILWAILIIPAFAFLLFLFNLQSVFPGQFLRIKGTIEKGLGDAFDKNVSIGNIDFFPYGELILNNVKIYDENNISYVNIKKCIVAFRILPLLVEKDIIITKINLIEPVFFPASKNLRVAKEKKAALGEYKLEFYKKSFINAESCKAIFNEINPSSDNISFNFWAKLKKGKGLYSEGEINLKEFRLKDYLLNDIFFFGFINKVKYKLRASMTSDKLLVEELILDFEQFKLEATGFIKNYDTEPTLDLRFTLKELNLPEKITLKSKLFVTSIRNFVIHVKDVVKERRWLVRLDQFRGRPAYLPTVVKIDNFYCNLKFSKEEFLIENLSCFLNDFPIGLKCKISSKLENPYIEFELISYPNQIPSLRPFNPLNFIVSFSGYKEGNSLKGKMSFDFEKLVSARPRKAHSVKLTAEDLLCSFSEEKLHSIPPTCAVLSVKTKNILCETNIPISDLKLEIADFSSLLYPDEFRIYFADLSLSGYDGALEGNGFLDFNNLPPDMFLDFKLDKFNMAELAKALKLDFDLAGTLSGKGIFDNKTDSYLKGTASISNGFVKNLELLDLVADFLSIVSLKDIYFENFSSNFKFSITEDKVSIDKIRLRSADVNLTAGFEFRERQKISGNMLVRLSTKLLKESFKLKLLFFLMGEELPYADFEFKIGGLMKSPHIKWLDTEFKKNVRRYLSERGKQTLETEVEEAIKPLLEGK